MQWHWHEFPWAGYNSPYQHFMNLAKETLIFIRLGITWRNWHTLNTLSVAEVASLLFISAVWCVLSVCGRAAAGKSPVCWYCAELSTLIAGKPNNIRPHNHGIRYNSLLRWDYRAWKNHIWSCSILHKKGTTLCYGWLSWDNFCTLT